MQSILKLIRWKNLLLIAIVQILIKYALLVPSNVFTTLNYFGFSLLVLATLCIAAAGNIINDVYDIEADKINKPNKQIVGKTISEKVAFNLYIILNIIGVGLGFYLSLSIGKSVYFSLFVMSSALLYIYSSYLKKILLIGNIAVSFLAAFSILIVGVFELLPVLNPENSSSQLLLFKIVLDYALFAFCINLIREIIKDIEDTNGDYKVGLNTLPIAIGRNRTTLFSFALTILFIFITIYYIIINLLAQPILAVYFVVFTILPLLYLSVKIYNSKSKKEYNHISIILKLIMLFGMLSLLIYPFIFQNA